MATYITRLIQQKEIARGTRLFEFEKPKGFKYKAGQSIDVVLRFDSPTGESNLGEGKMSQTFSLVSAPHEKILSIATRIRESPFKRNLVALKTGSRVKIEGPSGSFGLHEGEKQSAVFIAGGIGITPFRSILRERFSRTDLEMEKGSRLVLEKIFLFYSNRTEKDAAFLEELRGYESWFKNFMLVPVFTASFPRIDKKMLGKYIGNPTGYIFYIAGTLEFVTKLREVVIDFGASDDNIRTDEFSGY